MKLYDNLGHGKPIGRRQMLSRSALTVSAAAVVPPLAALGRATQVLAGPHSSGGPESFRPDPVAGLAPCLIFDLNGGAALPGNFLVSKDAQAASLLASYDQLGWNPRASGALDASFGLPMAAKASQILAGMRQTASSAALAKLRFGSFCHFSQDDSQVNKSSLLTLVSAAGLGGSLLSAGVGLTGSESGGNSASAVDDATRKPLTVRSLDDFLAVVSYGPVLKDRSALSLKALANALLKLNGEQSLALAKFRGGPDLAELAARGYSKNLTYAAGGASGLDPRLDQDFQSLYNLDAKTDPSSAAAVFAGVVMNVLRGNCGPGVLTIDGCDYHTGAQSDGDAKDLQIGQEIGRAVEAANRLNKSLFLQILTDGGLAANPGTRNWSSDAGDKGMTVIGYFDPGGAPTQPRLQIGSFTDGQSADRGSMVGSDPVLAAYAAFANYLNVAGQLGRFNDFVPGRPFDDAVIKTALVFDV